MPVNVLPEKSNQAIEMSPHTEGCTTRLEVSGYEMLNAAGEQVNQSAWTRQQQHLYTWHILTCAKTECLYQSLIREDWMVRLLMGDTDGP